MSRYDSSQQIEEYPVCMMPPVEAPAELIKISLKMKLVETVECALHKCLCIRNDRVQADKHLRICIIHLPSVIELFSEKLASASVSITEFSAIALLANPQASLCPIALRSLCRSSHALLYRIFKAEDK